MTQGLKDETPILGSGPLQNFLNFHFFVKKLKTKICFKIELNLFVYLPFYLTVFLPACVSVCMPSVYMFVCLLACLSICLPAYHLPTYLSVRLYFCLPIIGLSVFLPAHYLSIYLFIS